MPLWRTVGPRRRQGEERAAGARPREGAPCLAGSRAGARSLVASPAVALGVGASAKLLQIRSRACSWGLRQRPLSHRRSEPSPQRGEWLHDTSDVRRKSVRVRRRKSGGGRRGRGGGVGEAAGFDKVRRFALSRASLLEKDKFWVATLSVGAECDQLVNIYNFAVRCDRMWPNTQWHRVYTGSGNVPYVQFGSVSNFIPEPRCSKSAVGLQTRRRKMGCTRGPVGRAESDWSYAMS